MENGGVFFVKKWTFPRRRVHYVQYQYFFILHCTYLGEGCVRTHRTPSPAHGPVSRVVGTEWNRPATTAAIITGGRTACRRPCRDLMLLLLMLLVAVVTQRPRCRPGNRPGNRRHHTTTTQTVGLCTLLSLSLEREQNTTECDSSI